MPRYYKYKCSKCGYVLDESKPREPLMRDIEECPNCGRDKKYFDEIDDDEE